MPTIEDFTAALQRLLSEAERAGEESLSVRSGDLHRSVGDYPGPDHRMPQCCAAMRKAMRPGDRVISEPPSGQGASVVIEYQLPRSR